MIRPANRGDIYTLVNNKKFAFDLLYAYTHPVNHIFHYGCNGMIDVDSFLKVYCRHCRRTWSKTRPDTWSAEDIADLFYVRTEEHEGAMYKLMDFGGYYGLVKVA